jgi:hypothetical protein
MLQKREQSPKCGSNEEEKKIPLKGKLIKHYAMKAYGGADV